MGENLPEGHAEELFRRGIVPLLGIAEAMDAAAAAAFVGEAWGEPPSRPGGRRCRRGGVTRPLDTFVDRRSRADPPLEGGGDSALDSPKPPQKHCSHPPACPCPQAVAREVSTKRLLRRTALGFPVALKALGVAHKIGSRGGEAQFADEAAVRSAAEQLIGLGSGLYVERMVEGGVAELIVGVTRDPLFGPVMTVGSGGVLVELLKDSATLLLPAGREDIEAALRGLKLFPLLDGFRGRPKADLAAAIDAVLKICGLRAGQCRYARRTRHQSADRLRRRRRRLGRGRAAREGGNR